jgi:hypothetical protein
MRKSPEGAPPKFFYLEALEVSHIPMVLSTSFFFCQIKYPIKIEETKTSIVNNYLDIKSQKIEEMFFY